MEAVGLAVGVNASAPALKIVADSTSRWGSLVPKQMQLATFKGLV